MTVFKQQAVLISSFLIIVVALAFAIPQTQTQQEIRQRAQTTANQLYVSPSGSGDCTQASPCSLSTANGKATPGTTIMAASGTYNGNFSTTKGGAAGQFITFRSQVKHGATIVGTGKNTAIDIKHEYVRFQDFTVTGAETRNGFLISANNVEIVGNHIHTIVQFLTGGTSWEGGAGVYSGKSPLSNVLIDGNLIHDVGLSTSTQQLIHGMYLPSHVTNGRVTNNVIYNVEDFGLHPYDETEASGWHFINNTIANTGRGILQAPNGVTRNNIVYNTKGASYDIRGSGNVLSNNIAGGTGSGGSVSGVTSGVDPMFVNAASDDYNLKPGSPAIDKGTTEQAPPNDFNGKTRPQGAGIDLGAYEVGGTAVNPSPSTPVVNPTFGGIGTCPGNPSCPSPSPSIIISGVPIPTASTTTAPTISMETPEPEPTEDPCLAGDASLASHKSKSRHSQPNGDVSGFMEMLLNFFMELINMLLRLFGGGQIELPDPSPLPEPSESPSAAPDPCE